MIALLSCALATSGFDPATPDAVFTGAEVMSHDGQRQLWSRIDRYDDPDRTLFQQEDYSELFRWKDTEFTPHMLTLFDDAEPSSSTFLLHYGVNEATASGTPVLFVHGAGDNASRSTFQLRLEFEAAGRPFYAITFPHAHGDVFRQAEAVANAIAVIRERTGAPQVDLIAHSKGGPAIATYASNTPDADWNNAAYEAVGTNYRGDVRKMLFVASPLDGIDTAFRWPASNYLGFMPEFAAAPVSWKYHYPMGSVNWWVSNDLTYQDFMPGGGDPFPGQRQLLKRQDHPLPGTMPWLGGYSLQQDWYTTYEGGFGLTSYSDGIDDAIEAGGSFIDTLAAQGVDPNVQIYVLAGNNPMMPSGDPAFEDIWDGLASPSMWQLLMDSIDTWVTEMDATPAEVEGLSNGKLILGEVSGASDGLLFVDSALAVQNLTARGATVVQTRVAALSHTELMIASDTMGAIMHSLGDADPEEGAWMHARADRYIAEDTTAWMLEMLADPPPDDSNPNARGGVGGVGPASVDGGWSAMGCSTTGRPVAAFGLLPLLALAIRRRS
ncbi:MAG: hypothetical protein KC621_13790 [Myxococcales bacterium]|nr:hypothetical protein [Myxococcales bacterium]